MRGSFHFQEYIETLGFSSNGTTDGTLYVTDLYVVGDEFAVYVNDVLRLTTPDLPNYSELGVDPFADPPFTTNPDVAWSRSEFSKGTVPGIFAGDEIDIKITASAPDFTDNTVAVRLDGVPEPAAFLLLGTGLAALVAVRRWKR